MSQDLVELSKFVHEVNQSNSSLYKKEVIRKYPQCKKLFRYIYDNINYKYGVTPANIKKLTPKLLFEQYKPYGSIYDLLDALNNRCTTGHSAIKDVLGFITENKEHSDLILNIINRNLKTRTDAALINKVFPGCIPVFDVALATGIQDYDPGRTKIDWNVSKYLMSRKLDGCRCIAVIKNKDDIKLISRSGNEFLTLDILREELKKLDLENVVIDGEICLVDENGLEHFQNIMKEIRRKDHTIERPRFKVFDLISVDDFYNLYSATPFEDRLVALKNVLINSDIVELLDQTLITNWDQLDLELEKARSKGWEGLILRSASSPYEGKRTNNMLKVKTFIDEEYDIVDVTMGPIRYIAYQNGQAYEAEEEMLSSISIEYKGYINVHVGSGFSLEQRKHFYKHPQELIGKQVTVKHFGESKNQAGGLSLRFPTVKHLWLEGRREDVE